MEAEEWIDSISAWLATVCCHSNHCVQAGCKYIQEGWENILSASRVFDEGFFFFFFMLMFSFLNYLSFSAGEEGKSKYKSLCLTDAKKQQ